MTTTRRQERREDDRQRKVLTLREAEEKDRGCLKISVTEA